MKYCKKCGVTYSDAADKCPRCKLPLEPVPEGVIAHREDIPDDEYRRQRTRNWIGIAIGVPALFGLIYLFYYIMKILST